SVSSAGYGDVSPTLILLENGAVIETLEAHIPSGEVAHLKFKTKPTTVGPRAYSVEITPFADEAVTSNNIETFAVDVVRDKIRVLQVVGRPSWDERFLRQHLKENPNVDLISFFILRTPSDATGAPEKELALIPFPVERLFTTELKTFDVIVFQNFDFGPYRMEPYLRNIQQAVLDGLGFVMIGGNKSFGSGGYEGTPIETILPLRVANSDYIQQTIAPRLTPTGARHPILALGLWGGAPGELWKRLPSFRGYNKTLGLSPGAIALATHPADRGIDGKPLPLIAAREVQKGRSLAIATDNLWRWRFSSHADSDLAARAYHRFWANALRWLVRDPSHSRVKVRPLHRRIGKNEALVLKIETREQDYSPAPFSSATVQILDGQGTLLQTRTIELGENATGVAKLENLPKGALHIRVNAHLGNRDLGQTETVVVVEEDSQETTALTPNPEILRYLSEKSGGSWQALGDANLADLIIPDATRIEIDRIKNQPLWDNAWALGLAILLFGLDWALRRRMGYV
ncbi:hypothetical protein KAI87_15565, partial [Myxococcota bacterium]|nr:hypothetical protein [Myxococcota bacterium]